MNKTISRSSDRKLIFEGMEEGEAIIKEMLSYTSQTGTRKWDTSIMGLSVDELREILKLAETGI